MLISMTGFGQGEASNKALTVTVEVRSVNHRFLDCSFKLPRSLQVKERDIREMTKAKLSRGRVYVTVSVESNGADRNVGVDESLMASYLDRLRAFAKAQGLPDDIRVDTLVQLPDVVSSREDEPELDAVWPLVEKSLGQALDSCRAMRIEEGKALERDLIARMKEVSATVVAIAELAPSVSQRHTDNFRKRVTQMLGDIQVGEDRLAAEIAVMADRLDISEEITRLRSHEAQFNASISEGGEVSKKLTYLLQEMHREASTIGAKASDSEVIRHVVALKEETEKLREQVQNLE